MSVNECFSAIFFARRVETAWRNLEQSLFSLVVLMNTMINSFWLVCEIFFSLVFESSAERRTRGFDRSVLLARGTTLLGLLRQQDGVNVRQDTAGRDGDGAQKLGQFLVVANGELDVARHDARLFVIARGVTREFEHFSREVFLRTSNTNQTHPSVTSSSFHPTPRVTELERLSPPPPTPPRPRFQKRTMTAAMYTGAPAPTRVAYLPAFKYRATRPTGNCNPALADRLIAFLPVFPLPRPDIVRLERLVVTRRSTVDDRLDG